MNLNQLTIKQAREGLAKKEFSSVEIVNDCLNQIEKHDKQLNAFLTVAKNEALAQAKQIDQDPQNLPLEGIPIALKDLYSTKGIKTTAGSNVLSDYIPPYDATVVTKLKSAGAIIIGKTNEDAWGHGASGENSDFGPTKNPWNLSKVSGGSSSGSAAALASDMCLASGGTDTGGSIRLPASFCNLVGLKPTYGRVSRYGISAMASSLDTIGHFTKTVYDNALYLQVTAGKDPLDATTPEVAVPQYLDEINTLDLTKLRIGIPKEYFIKGIDLQVESSVKEAIKFLLEQGARVEEISLPHTQDGIAVYYIVMSSETSSNLGRYDGIRYGNKRDNFGNEARRRIMLGTYSLSSGYYDAYYKKAMQVRTLIKQDFEKAFQKVDVIITPVGATPAFELGAKQDPLQMYLSDIFTAPASLAGLPALSVPCGFTSSNLPIGMQLIGAQFNESKLFQVGHFYEQAHEYYKHKPII
ncbi:Asp-tRNA(Asn)/Glu-tRNA(Gln) amidotransferase GatCAB subunit A [Candidatus Beckwithbacteria bacterium CG23_combo_of_CG06-09_8_20_14_all_34_8]|uniref:Glutamyl-tRNA(Gln) amidotransferase subunit A n=1 Tax=Candidatus Beckwithbacteria bacterium CG23_combo_of_CG06-09_8_20_14_all_34_8 TaxID=1974497 RepID=A0A2H0B5Y8_9BACT|nr:MAG: Asp-tRNA(Asn)/Glu-tRNA(Gln) amidotransferase GatCAB subunit A [Candidatus Beckwithbacteria bacterium CG23_combo_of_CG06-09_8_20_14_all_34_8]